MFQNLIQYKSTSTPFAPLSEAVEMSQFPIEQKMVKSFNSYSKKNYYDISSLRDKALDSVKKSAIDELVDLFPDYEIFFCLRKTECLNFGPDAATTANSFRISASRNDATGVIYLTLQLKHIPEEPVLVPPALARKTRRPLEEEP